MEEKRQIKNFYGKLVATIETKSNGCSYIYDFWGKMLGWYDPKGCRGNCATYDFWGKMIAEGDALTSLIKDWT